MASNASSLNTMESLNPCCAKWRKSYAKIEGKRDALREGVKILKDQIDRLQSDNDNLKKVCDEERARLNVVEEENRKEASLRISLEKEIAALKSEISFPKSEVASGNVDLDKEATHLRTCLLEREVEIDRLKQLLDEEKMRADAEKKAAEMERKNAAELQNSLQCARSKSDEASKMADAAAREAEDHRNQLEALKSEFEKANLRWEEVNRELEAEKKNALKEKSYSDERVKEKEFHANDLLKQLEEERKKVKKLQKEMQEIVPSKKPADSFELDEVKRKLEAEKKKVSKEKKHVEQEKERVIEQRKIAEANEKRLDEERCRADKLLMQLEEEKEKNEKYQREMQDFCSSHKVANSSEIEELKRNLEEEQKKVAQTQRCVEEEKRNGMEQRRIAEANENKFIEEKCRVDELLMQLKEEKQKFDKYQREMQAHKTVKSSELQELKRILEEEKKKFAQAQRCVEEEKARVVEQIRIAEANEKWYSEEKCRAEKLLMELEEEKQKVEKLQREMQEVMSTQESAYSSELAEVNGMLEAEKKKAARERKRADLELCRKEEQKKLAELNIKKAMEEKCRADKLYKELESSRETIGKLESELNKVNDMLKAERKEVEKVDVQKVNLEEKGKIALANEMRDIEKCRGDRLLQELEIARQKLQDMEHELHNDKLCRGLVGSSGVSPAFVVNEQAARVKLLQEQIKFEKKRVKHAKEVAKLEKGRNRILQQELQRLKQDFQGLLDHLGMLSDIFGSRNGVTNVAKKSGQCQMHLCGDNELRMSSLSSRDASCLFKPDMHLRQAGLRAESISGMENELDPLQGGSPGDTIRTSALKSNTASFSDEQLVGSQERVAGPLTMTTDLSLENTNQQVTRLRCPNELNKRKVGDIFGIVGELSMKNSDETATGHVKKRRKIYDEFESIKDMQFEGKRIFQEAEKKLISLQNTLLQPMKDGQTDKEKLLEPINKTHICGNSEWLSQTRKPFLEAEVIERVGDSNVQTKLDKLFVPSTAQTRESSQLLPVPERDWVTQQDSLLSFEQMLNGDYMKLLDLDSTIAEECFRMAIERPLSPIPAEFDLLEFGQKVGRELQSVPLSGTNEATYQHNFSVQNEKQLYFILFSDIDTSSMARIYSATRTCVSQCSSHQTKSPVKDMLGVLLLEKDLIPREKACILFSLMLFNISGSSGKSMNFHSQEQMDSFSAHIHKVLFNTDTRDLCAKICDLRELLTLIEYFVLNRKIMCNYGMTCELLDGCGSSFEILLEGEKIVLWPKMASTTLVVAATIVLASIAKAIGHVSFVCEVSLKVLQIGKTDYSLALTILHTFAYICGEEYVTISNDSQDMKVVKSVVTFMEGSLGKQPNTNCQSGDTQFIPCVRCPFSDGSILLDDVSTELLEELQRNIVPQNPAVLAQSSSREALTCLLSDILSSLELVASIMGWDRVCNRIVPELFKKLKSTQHDRVFSTALVALLGYIGRLGVEGHGYDDPGVEGIKNHLLDLLRQTVASKCNAILSMAIVYELIGLYPKGHEMFQKGNIVELPSEGAQSAASDIIREFLSSLSNEQTTLLSGLMKPYTEVNA